MPYIKQEKREEYKPLMDMLCTYDLLFPGDLNYILTLVCKRYLDSWGPGDNTYREYNDVIGALESCKLEFYRRQVASYEDEKVISNGDVYNAKVDTVQASE